ncbi:putative zinc finger protein 862-like [Triplophysa rosa]|uniref:Zinc finger protein 862-like n=1 Tax=Triplophysa rosa TaxID=992332 RepID=A0A9W7WXP9_TRIRA|nr:putative zinc finger protein 862-like [Triplophysa rosa]
MWKEQERRVSSGKEISTLLNADQLQKNRYYVSSIIAVIGFLVDNQLPLRGKLDAFDNMAEGGSGLFLSLLDYTIKKDPLLADAVKTLPRNVTYTRHNIQNELIGLLSDVVTETIVKEVGNSYYTLKVYGTRDPTGCENISIVIRFVKENESCEVAERLLTIATTEMGDAQTLTDTILAELNKAGLNPSKILSQVYDGASLMSGKVGGVQMMLQEKLKKDIPYVHCLNHQLHLVVVHTMSSEGAVKDFFNVCNSLYKYCKKPTIAVHYKGERLKRLLEQSTLPSAAGRPLLQDLQGLPPSLIILNLSSTLPLPSCSISLFPYNPLPLTLSLSLVETSVVYRFSSSLSLLPDVREEEGGPVLGGSCHSLITCSRVWEAADCPYGNRTLVSTMTTELMYAREMKDDDGSSQRRFDLVTG